MYKKAWLQKNGAGEGDRTLATGLEGRGSTTELHPQVLIILYFIFLLIFLERVKGIEPSQPAWKAGALPLSYTREYFICFTLVVVESGFEPLKALLTDLQSAPFGHSGTPPYITDYHLK